MGENKMLQVSNQSTIKYYNNIDLIDLLSFIKRTIKASHNSANLYVVF